MTVRIVITCDHPMIGGICAASIGSTTTSVNLAREQAQRGGWWHDPQVGDRCPDHGPRRRGR